MLFSNKPNEKCSVDHPIKQYFYSEASKLMRSDLNLLRLLFTINETNNCHSLFFKPSNQKRK